MSKRMDIETGLEGKIMFAIGEATQCRSDDERGMRIGKKLLHDIIRERDAELKKYKVALTAISSAIATFASVKQCRGVASEALAV